MRRNGRVEDGRGSLGHAATLRFPSPLIEPDVQISRIRLSDKTSRLCSRVQRLPQFLNTRGVDRLPNLQVLHHLLRLS